MMNFLVFFTIWTIISIIVWYLYHLLCKYPDYEPSFLICFLFLPIVIISLLTGFIYDGHLENIEHKIKNSLDNFFGIKGKNKND